MFVASATPVSEELKSSRYCCTVCGSVSYLAALFVDLATLSNELAKLKFVGNSCLVWGTISLYVALIVDSATPVTSPTSAIRKNLINGLHIYLMFLLTN